MYVCMYGLRQNVEQRVGPQLGFVLLLDFVEKGLTWDGCCVRRQGVTRKIDYTQQSPKDPDPCPELP